MNTDDHEGRRQKARTQTNDDGSPAFALFTIDFMSSFRGDHPRTQTGEGKNHGDTCHNEFRSVCLMLL